jgi:hypothetical protein
MKPNTNNVTLFSNNTLQHDKDEVLATRDDMLAMQKELETDIATLTKELVTLLTDKQAILRQIDSLEKLQLSFKFSKDVSSLDLETLQEDLVMELTQLHLLEKTISDKESELAEAKASLEEVNSLLHKIVSLLSDADILLEQQKNTPPKR